MDGPGPESCAGPTSIGAERPMHGCPKTDATAVDPGGRRAIDFPSGLLSSRKAPKATPAAPGHDRGAADRFSAMPQAKPRCQLPEAEFPYSAKPRAARSEGPLPPGIRYRGEKEKKKVRPVRGAGHRFPERRSPRRLFGVGGLREMREGTNPLTPPMADFLLAIAAANSSVAKEPAVGSCLDFLRDLGPCPLAWACQPVSATVPFLRATTRRRLNPGSSK